MSALLNGVNMVLRSLFRVGVLVFPHEMAPDALGELLRGYEPLRSVLTVKYPADSPNRVEIDDADGNPVVVDPASIEQLPALLRNSIAHFNILPIARDGRFAGIRVWNRDRQRQITFVADIDFDQLRPLARYVLKAIRSQGGDTDLVDPHDPIAELEGQSARPAAPKRKAQVLNPEIWAHFLDAHDGDETKARNALDRLVKNEADRLRDKRKAG